MTNMPPTPNDEMPASRPLLSRRVLAVLSVVLTILAMAWVARDLNFNDVLSALRQLPAWPFVLSFLCICFVTLLRGARLYALVRHTGAGFRVELETILIGYFFLTTLPLRTGEFIRVIYLSRRGNMPLLTATAGAVAERTLDLIALAFWAAIFLSDFAGQQLADLPFSSRLLGAGAGLGVLVVVLIGYFAQQRLKDQAQAPSGLFGKLIHDTLRGFTSLGTTKDFLLSLSLSLGLWFMVIFTYRFALQAIVPDIEFSAAAVVMISTSFAIALPSTPGFFGTYHAGFVAGAMLIGIPKQVSFPAAIVLHLVLELPFLLIGGLVLYTGGRRALTRTATDLSQ